MRFIPLDLRHRMAARSPGSGGPTPVRAVGPHFSDPFWMMAADQGKRERLRFESFRIDTFPDGFCRATATVEWEGGVFFTGESRATQTLEGRLRAGAEALLRAASEATGGTLDLEIRGTKAVRAFDTWVIMVLLQGRSPERAYRLIGAYACPDDDTARGAALATLDATNRVLQRYVSEE